MGERGRSGGGEDFGPWKATPVGEAPSRDDPMAKPGVEDREEGCTRVWGMAPEVAPKDSSSHAMSYRVRPCRCREETTTAASQVLE